MFSLKRIVLFLAAGSIVLASASAFAGDKDAYLGVTLQNISSSMAKALQMDDDGGVLIGEVINDSPADKAGLQDGDVVLKYDGTTIGNNKDLLKAVKKSTVGDKVKIKILRDGKTKNINVVVGEKAKSDTMVWFDSDENEHAFPSDTDFEFIVKDFTESFKMDRGFLGVELDDLNDQLGDYFGVENGQGVLVTKITEDSGAQKAGIKAGDVIVRMGDSEITSAGDLHKAMAETKPEEQVKIEVKRKGKTKKFDVTLGEMSMGSGKHIEFITDDNHISIHAPKMMMKHIKGHTAPHAVHEMHRMKFHEELKRAELEEVRESLEDLRMELEDLRKDLKKK